MILYTVDPLVEIQDVKNKMEALNVEFEPLIRLIKRRFRGRLVNGVARTYGLAVRAHFGPQEKLGGKVIGDLCLACRAQ